MTFIINIAPQFNDSQGIVFQENLPLEEGKVMKYLSKK